MVIITNPLRLLFSGIMIIALASCVSTVQVKDVTADKMGYLNQKFSIQSLSPDIMKQVSKDDSTLPAFQRMNVIYEAVIESTDGKKETAKITSTLLNAGNGLIQHLRERSMNDIPYFLQYSIDYKGFLPIKWQAVPLKKSMTGRLVEIKQITRFDHIPSEPKENSEYVFEFLMANQEQIANFGSCQEKCKSGTYYPAKEINSKLEGSAIDFSMENYYNNVLQWKGKRVFLKKYGVMLPLDIQSSNMKESYKIVAIDVN